ncbi:MAG: homoserine O-acetyltransferase [Planctomycetaceae bacterium]|nr:homoserine O-acetyltransferase [Planctomycetaceae bacterium]
MADIFESSDSQRGAFELPYAQTRTFEGPFTLKRGGVLQDVTILFETYGELNEARDNVILLSHALTGDSHVARHDMEDVPGWWDILIGPGKSIDTNRYFVICTNNLGSCRGTTGPSSLDPATGKPYGASFPEVTMEDNVKLQKMLLDDLGITQLLAVVGGSVGGMMCLIWAAQYPEMVQGAVTLATSPCLTSQAIAFDVVGRNAITSDPHFHGGNYYGKEEGPSVGLAIARMLGHITYLSRESMIRKFDVETDRCNARKIETQFETEFAVGSYLAHQGSKFNERFDANSYITLTNACDFMDFGDNVPEIAENLASAKCKWLIMSFSSDWLLPPYQSEQIVDALISRKKAVSYINIQSDAGHDAFLLPLQLSTYGGLIEHFLNHLHDSQATAQKQNRDIHFVADRHEMPRVSQSSGEYVGLHDGFGRSHDGRLDFESILELIPQHASVLDLGCGNGDLLKRLRQRSGKSRLMGIELSERCIQKCVARGLDVVQKDINQGLKAFHDRQYEYVVLSCTLQTIREVEYVLEEMLRVGRFAIVSFPNSAYLPWRTRLFKDGRMPERMSEIGGDSARAWFNTKDVRFLTLADFHDFCDQKGYSVRRQIALDTVNGKKVFQNPNDEASMAIIELSR